jgi:hypothetical protein
MAKRQQQTVARKSLELDRQLTSYSAAVRVSAAVGSLRRRLGNWPIYAAATGSALAMATGASAGIIYSGIEDISVTAPPHGNSILPIDLDGAGHIFNLRAGAGTSFFNGGVSSAVFGVVDVQANNPVKVFVMNSNTQLVKDFAAGARISALAGLPAFQGIVKKGFSTGSTFGAFKAGVPGFAGLEIASTIHHPETQYGWIRLEFENGGDDGLPATLTVIDWAVETTPGEAILTGQTVEAVPEPGTMALGLLASGAAGITAWKRRRRQERTGQ